MTAVAIVGCGKSKRSGTHAARDLYTGPLFRAALAHAERTADLVYILSAKHGLVDLGAPIANYEQRLDGRKTGLACWASGVALSLLGRMQPPMTVTIYAGADYANPVADALRRLPRVEVELPLAGMTQGTRLAWFKAHRPGQMEPAAGRDAVTALNVAGRRQHGANLLHVVTVARDGSHVIALIGEHILGSEPDTNIGGVGTTVAQALRDLADHIDGGAQ